MSDTPRTDALRKTYAGISNANPSPLLDHHEALERELGEAKEACRLEHQFREMENGRADAATIERDQLLAERDEWKSRYNFERSPNAETCDQLKAELNTAKHELSLIAADVEAYRTDCSTPVFQMVRNLKEARDTLGRELGEAKRENEGLANLLWEHPTAPCDQDSVFESMKRVQALRAEVARQKARSVPIDPSISDKFEIKDHSVFVIRNGTAYLAGIRELIDLTELVESRNELAKLKEQNSTFQFELSIWRKADAVLDADPSSTDDPCYINIQRIISQRDKLRAEVEKLKGWLENKSPEITYESIVNSRDQWRAVAEQACDLIERCHDSICVRGYCTAVKEIRAAYEKLKGGS